MDKIDTRFGEWLRDGYTQTRQDLPFWAAAAALYVVGGALLMRLAFVGPVLLVFYSPVVAAGVLRAAPAVRATPLTALFWGALRTPILALPVMIAATVILGAWVFLTVVGMLLGVDGPSLAGLFTGHSDAGRAAIAVALAAFWALRTGLVVSALYLLAGIVSDHLAPLDALEQTATLWSRQPGTVSALALCLVLPMVVAAYLPGLAFAAIVFVLAIPSLLATGASYRALRIVPPVAQTAATV
ncbi:MAG: hypothetical protein ACYCXG_05655 [Acidiferrobacter sp.]